MSRQSGSVKLVLDDAPLRSALAEVTTVNTSPELVDLALSLLNTPDKLFRVEWDTAVAGEVRVSLYPADGLRELTAAAFAAKR